MELVSEGDHTFRDFMLVAWPTDNRPKKAVGTIRLIDDNNKEFIPKYTCYSNEQKSVSANLSISCLSFCVQWKIRFFFI